MNGFFLRLSTIFAIFAAVFAKTAEYTVCEIDKLGTYIKELDCAVTNFHHCDGGCSRCRELKGLLHIYHLNAEVDNELDQLIEDLQCSCCFGTNDSVEILLAMSEIQDPLTKTLDAFKSKHCDFEGTIGPTLTHRIIGGNICKTRCLTMDLFRTLECRLDSDYKEILSATQAEIDGLFQKVLCLY